LKIQNKRGTLISPSENNHSSLKKSESRMPQFGFLYIETLLKIIL